MVEEVKVKKKRAKKTTDKVYKKYVEPLPITKKFKKMPLSRLKPNMINTGWLTGVYIETEEVDVIGLSNSWEELLALLLGTIYLNHKTDFIKLLIEKKILGPDFDVTTAEIRFISETKSKIIDIKGTGFKIVTSMNPRLICNIIVKLASTLGLKDKQIKLDVVPIKDAPTTVKLKTGTASVMTKRIDIAQAYETVNEGSKIKSITIFNSEEKATTFVQAAKKLINWVLAMNGEDTLYKSMVCNTTLIGITAVEDTNSSSVTKIRGTKLFIYSNGENPAIVEYMLKLVKFIGISTSLVELELKQMYFKED